MPYKLVSFEKEQSAVSGSLFVAMIQKEGDDQPFRMSIEHFTDPVEARAEVDRWIKTQDEDDARWAEEQARVEAEAAGDATIETLNKTLE